MMGKKHKKHRVDKGVKDAECAERPLKLVLKVAGNEVSTGRASVGNSKVESDKHKDKKKKKKDKKDKESPPGTPVEDKKKKMPKKRKATDVLDLDYDDRSRTPARSDISQDKPLTPSLTKLEDTNQTPLQEALNQLIRQLQRKDPSAFFSFPITDLIAPGYSLVIKSPMDFSTMKEKVKKECYSNLDEMKLDFRTMCENAMAYNKPETIYYKAAKKLLHSGMKILSPERLQSLKQSIEFMANMKTGKGASDGDDGSSYEHKLGFSPTDVSDNSQSPRAARDTPSRDSKDVVQAEKDLEEIKKLIEESGGKLSNRSLGSELEFERRKSDGSTTLGILNPADLQAGDPGYCPVKLGMMGFRLQAGVNTLQGFKEDKRNRVTPVSYMNYGPFTSYAPTYDSTFANVSKEESDLIYHCYGDESSLQSSDSLSDFLAKSEEHVYRLADNVLDALTNGEHSKNLKIETNNQIREETTEKTDSTDDEAVRSEVNAASNMTVLSSVVSVGLGLDLPADSFDSKEAERFQKKLDETTLLLLDLQEAQRARLSTKQPPNMICLIAPTTKELQLAEKVTENLAQLTGQVTPADVSCVYGIRKAMGVSLPAGEAEDTLINLTTVGAEQMDTEFAGSDDDAPIVTSSDNVPAIAV